ncbi:MAG: Lactonase, 7-bladed beta propeller [Candidatus Sulfotelmatobacter sp.]|nr:Lactonase, 7-bladed beta propeller [Candidatus Sulfotelmatobacter sp.]
MLKSVYMLWMVALAISVVSPNLSSAQDERSQGAGAVFVMTNAADRNEVISFRRAPDGSLQENRRFATGGRGSGGNNDPLESQGSLTLSQDHTLLFAVNAGSGEISVFRIHGTDLSLADKKLSGGSEPNAVAQNGHLVYVLNAGGSSSVVGFQISDDGRLRQIPNSLSFLSTNTSGAASLALSPNGQVLLVTERLTNDIDAFAVHSDGTLSPIVINPSAGPGLFAVSFAPNGTALAVETGPVGGQNASAISSYAVASNGTLTPISTSVPTLGAASCWNAVTPNGEWVYTSNAGSSTISGFTIAPNGTLIALPGTILGTNPAGATNLDIAISADGKFLYSLDGKIGMISTFGIQPDGTLLNLGTVGGLPENVGFNGIAAI